MAEEKEVENSDRPKVFSLSSSSLELKFDYQNLKKAANFFPKVDQNPLLTF
jgi:hypothetical protein